MRSAERHSKAARWRRIDGVAAGAKSRPANDPGTSEISVEGSVYELTWLLMGMGDQLLPLLVAAGTNATLEYG